MSADHANVTVQRHLQPARLQGHQESLMQAGQARCDDQSEHQSLLALSSLCACRHARDVQI